ncbi:UNVERIFIED_CONTAM: hypothetical protein Sindi_2641900 [Sesamum indicum]
MFEKRLRAFLWKGTMTSGYAKVAWQDVCRPIEEGGMITRDIHLDSIRPWGFVGIEEAPSTTLLIKADGGISVWRWVFGISLAGSVA